MKKILFLCVLFFSSISLLAKPKLSDFQFIKHSQFGEDGIIEKIFEIIGTKTKFCVEFGGYDGISMSNTAYLWQEKGWKSLLIEYDSNLFALMMGNIAGYNCSGINAKVGIGDESLENILKNNGFIEEIDLLSIDIDGEDYYVFESLNTIKPRLIICEFNPTIPAHIDCYQRYGTHGFGCSVGALTRIAESKGYKLISILGVNCFFVRSEDFPKFSAFETDVEHLRNDKSLRYIITSYGGEYRVIEENGTFASGKITYGIGNKYSDIIYGNFVESNIILQK